MVFTKICVSIPLKLIFPKVVFNKKWRKQGGCFRFLDPLLEYIEILFDDFQKFF
jgi:hypothetical protein